MNRLSWSSAGRSVDGLSTGSDCAGRTAVGSVERRLRKTQFILGSPRGSRTTARRRGSVGDLTLTYPLQVGLGADDLAFEGLNRLGHRVHGLGAEGVQGIHRGEHVVEGRLQFGD